MGGLADITCQASAPPTASENCGSYCTCRSVVGATPCDASTAPSCRVVHTGSGGAVGRSTRRRTPHTVLYSMPDAVKPYFLIESRRSRSRNDETRAGEKYSTVTVFDEFERSTVPPVRIP